MKKLLIFSLVIFIFLIPSCSDADSTKNSTENIMNFYIFDAAVETCVQTGGINFMESQEKYLNIKKFFDIRNSLMPRIKYTLVNGDPKITGKAQNHVNDIIQRVMNWGTKGDDKKLQKYCNEMYNQVVKFNASIEK